VENKESIRMQCFQDFEKAFLFFEKCANKEIYTLLEISGLVQIFDITFEYAWKTIKGYLYEQGIDTNFPREALKEAFNTQIIMDGHVWIDMLEKKNELSHTFNEEVGNNALEIIKNKYYPAVKQVYQYLKGKSI
jgi:nucleotidyltransferase substrate binding protein (TIGR01987 family)